MKQGELVQCLSTMSKVLSAGLMVFGDYDFKPSSTAQVTTRKDAASSTVP
jgi:hypothetical protein